MRGRRSGSPRCRWARGSRSRSSPTSRNELIDFVDSLGLDAYLVGGAVRDELLGIPHKDQDFVVPNVGYDELHAALAPYGRVDDLEVAGRRVGLRLYPRDGALREYAPAGIEFAPPRTEHSTGPGRHDFEIVASADVTLEQDMGRRDFTINAIAKRLATGELLDPFHGREDLEQRVLRTVSPQSFREDPLRLVRGLRFVSQLGVEPDEQTLRQMHDEASSIRLVSGERIGGGLTADGMGELSKLLLGAAPARALRLMRDTGVLVELLPEFAPTIGYDQKSARQMLPLDEHIFTVVQAAADAGAPLRVRLAALLHDLGKAHQEERHADLSMALAASILRRLRYPSRLSREVLAIIRKHSFHVRQPDPVSARRFLAKYGDTLAFDLVMHKESDYEAKAVSAEDRARLAAFHEQLDAQRGQPHRIADLAVDGSDLLELGVPQGPEIGQTLDRLLARVVDEPDLNTRDRLLELARVER